MSEKRLAKSSRSKKFFKKNKAGRKFTQDIGRLSLRNNAPYVISGGQNTERFYFQHISSLKIQELNVKPQFFQKEASYFKIFPQWIEKILGEDPDAKIYCVFDMDTVNGGSEQNKKNHRAFLEKVKSYIENKRIVLCPSMPCFEYWFYLHFDKSIRSFRDCESVTKCLEKHMRSFFPKSRESLLDIIKAAKPLSNPNWVDQLCNNEKLNYAIENAEINYNKIKKREELDKSSYSLVYLMFETLKKKKDANSPAV